MSDAAVQATLVHLFVLITGVVTLALAATTEERVEALQRAADLALHDGLTGLPNRRLLSDRVAQARAALLREGTPATVWLLDLDGFKAVNDSAGHEAGDALLVQVAGRLHGAVRDGDTVARLGGDEFAVLTPGITVDSALGRKIDRRLRSAVTGPADPGQLSRVAASLGGARLQPAHSEADVLRAADAVMYADKSRRRAFDALTPAGSGDLPRQWATAPTR